MLHATTVTQEAGKPYSRLPTGEFVATKRTFVKDVTVSYRVFEPSGTWNPSPWEVQNGSRVGPPVWVPDAESGRWRDLHSELHHGFDLLVIRLNSQPIMQSETYSGSWGNPVGVIDHKYDADTVRYGFRTFAIGLTLEAGDKLQATALMRKDDHDIRILELGAGYSGKFQYGFIFDVEDL